MTFTFDTSLATDLALCRFHIGDVNEEGHYLEDETIAYFVTNYSLGEAVVSCISHIITQLSAPNFNQDWLNVSLGEARKGYETLLAQKKIEFGISRIIPTATISLPYRADSNQDSSVSTYADDANDTDDEW
jgi:hypothetical protein